MEELRDYLTRLIATRRREPGDDLISRLAAERVATGEMTEEELVGLSVLLLIAGHETTSNMIGLSTLVLLEHPEQLAPAAEAARADRRHRRGAAALPDHRADRADPGRGRPTPRSAGTAARGGRRRAAVGRQPRRRGVPRRPRVRPDRGSHQHMAFGFGIHQCIGQPLARAELRIALSELITRLPGLALAVDPDDVAYRDAWCSGCSGCR